MSSIITGVLKLTVGQLWGKVRNYTADKLKDGDLTDEECRKLIVQDMEGLKSKLDGLSRKDLLSSTSFLKEGAALLAISLNSSKHVPTAQDQTADLSQLAPVEAFRRLKIISEDRFPAAKECFKAAREEATRAFNNTALSLEDRVLATKLRVTARILESLHEPDVAGLAGESFLKELHEMPAVQEVFSVYFQGGMRSYFNKTKRLEIAKSVLLINLVLYNFTKTFTKVPLDIFNWPRIKVGGKEYHPILGLDDNLWEMALQEFGVEELPALFHLRSGRCIPSDVLAVNSKGEFIIKERQTVSVVDDAGQTRSLFSFLELKVTEIDALAVDECDDMYIVTSSITKKYKISIIEANGNMKYQSRLEFLDKGVDISIAVNKDKIILAESTPGKPRMYVCDSRGQLEYSFSRKPYERILLAISDTNDIFAVKTNCRRSTVDVFSEEGILRQTIRLPKDDLYKICGIAFNFLTKNILLLAREKYVRYESLFSYFFRQRKRSLVLISYPEASHRGTPSNERSGYEVNGKAEELEPKIFALHSNNHDWPEYTGIYSHPNGPVIVKSIRGVLYI